MTGEIWYILQVRTAGNAFYWRLDTIERFAPWLRMILYGVWLAWMLVLGIVGVLVSTLGGLFPLGVFLLPILLIWAFLNRGSRDAASDWAVVIWPLRLFEGAREARQEYAFMYAPAVLGALQAAANSVEQNLMSPQVPRAPVSIQPPVIPQQAPTQAGLPPTPSGSAQPHVASPPILGKVRK